MNEIKVLGKQEFMGMEIPIVVGGFGEDCKVVTDKIVADIHGTELKEIKKSVNRLISKSRMVEGIDFIDILPQVNSLPMDLEVDFGIKPAYLNRTKNIFVLSERGYSKLIKAMDDDKSWDVMDRLIDEYFTMKETIKEMAQMLTQEEILGLAIFKAKTREEALVAASELDRYRKEQLAIAEKVIEEQKPLVEMCFKRRSCEGLIQFSDIKDVYNLRHGQLGTYLKTNGYIHKTRQEVNEKGKGLFRVYGEEFASVGITEDGVRFIDEHIEEIRQSPCRIDKKGKVA